MEEAIENAGSELEMGELLIVAMLEEPDETMVLLLLELVVLPIKLELLLVEDETIVEEAEEEDALALI